MDFRVLLAVGIACGCFLATPGIGPTDRPQHRQVLRPRIAQTITPVTQTGSVLESSSLKSAVFRTIHYQRQVEGVPLEGGLDELPLKRHLPVWVF